jgi:CelD/BcsL family acetyltransferase involved in cellulose biosynthesis
VKVQVFNGRQGLQELAPAWQALTAGLASPRFFHLVEWHQCNLDFLEPEPEAVSYCAFFDGTELVAILPIRKVMRTYGGIPLRCLELLQHDHMWLTDIVVSANCLKQLSALHLVDVLRKCKEIRWDILVARHILEDSTLAALDIAGRYRWSLKRAQTACSYIPIRPYEQVLVRLSKKALANLRQAANRLSRMGEPSYAAITGTSSLVEAFGDFLKLEGSGWKGAGGTGTALQVDSRLVDFYCCLTERLGVTGNCEIHLLQLDGRSIAAMFTVVSGGTSYALKVGYDETYGKASPAHLLIQHMMKYYAAGGVTHTLNFVTAMDWVRPWRPSNLTVENRYYFNKTAFGLLGYGGLALRKGLASRGGA